MPNPKTLIAYKYCCIICD